MPSEYKILPFQILSGEKGIKQAERDLNAMGGEGWEVFSVIPGTGGDPSRFLAVAKRLAREKRDRRKSDRATSA
jgi:hypothetical protein